MKKKTKELANTDPKSIAAAVEANMPEWVQKMHDCIVEIYFERFQMF